MAEDLRKRLKKGALNLKGIDEGVDEQLNLDQLYRDVLRAVEDAINPSECFDLIMMTILMEDGNECNPGQKAVFYLISSHWWNV